MTEDIRRVLIIYTGGTIGMMQGPDGYQPVAGWMEKQLRSFHAFQDPNAPPRTTPPTKNGVRIHYDILEYNPLLDSANMEIHHWVRIAEDIIEHYSDYHGFVILHGTDTMAYTASALSFMLVNLRKTVVMTGSQIPMSEVRNDAINNVLGALTMAGLYKIPEVCLCFDNQLFRGNRCQKFDASGLGAFQSGNLPPLATIGIDITVNWHLIRPAPARPLRLRPIREQNVIAIRFFPGIRTEVLRQLLQPPIRGVVLETYGAGNVPSTREDLLFVLQEAIDRGVLIVNCTQCFKGMVTSDYATGSVLARLGVLNGSDMTPEAALTKLSYLLSQDDLNPAQIRQHFIKDLRGEMTPRREEQRFSFQEQSFVDSVAKVLAQGGKTALNDEVSSALYPVLMCSAASRGDIEALDRMLKSSVSIDVGDYDGRTPLHLAAAEGQAEMTAHLLQRGADITQLDRWGNTPLREAIRHQHDPIIEQLIGAGAVIRQEEIHLMFCEAVQLKDILQVQRCLNCGADPRFVGPLGESALQLAERLELWPVVELLNPGG